MIIAEKRVKKTSLLEKLARVVEPPKEATPPQSVARRIRPLAEIAGDTKGVAKMIAEARDAGGRAKPTNGHVKHLDGTAKIFYTDGSLRHPGGKASRAQRNVLKKQRKHTLRFGRTK